MISKYKRTPAIYISISILFLIIIYATFNVYGTILHLYGSSITLSLDKKPNDSVLNYDIKFSQDFIRNHLKAAEELSHVHWLRIIKRYIPLPLESGYGSHKLALLAASILTAEHGGPVMEMGCGYHSTLLLHQIVVIEQKRYLLSTDTDREWLSKFESNMSSSIHQFRHISQTSEWDLVGNDPPRWSIVFIDHKPGERRVIDIIRLANVSDIIIIHDTETASYNYEQGLSLYPYRYRYNYLPTCTDVVSKNNETLFRNIQYLLELTIKMKLPK
jgi:hypothetical protein